MLTTFMFETGSTFDRFVIEAHLGAGGMAKVYRARHAKLGTVHALKVLLPEYAREEPLRDRFLSEGRIQASLNHPNIVRVTDTVDDGEFAALVMDYIEGITLRQYLRDLREPPSAEQVRGLFLQVLAGVGHAHAAGVIHRDLKPENVMVQAPAGQSPVARVLDFGIAKVLHDGVAARTRTGVIMGTPQYMSPEQLLGAREVTPRSDIFSLGATLYVLATRKLPFAGATEFVILRNIQQGIFELPEHAHRGVDRRIAAAIVRALSPNPARRFATCEEFAEAIQPAAAKAWPLTPTPAPSGSKELSGSTPPTALRSVAIEESEQADTEPGVGQVFLEVEAEETYEEEEVFEEEVVARPGSWFRSEQVETVESRRVVEHTRIVRRVEEVPFVAVDPGQFTMGSPELEASRRDDEVEHEVLLNRPYLLQATLLTQAQWQAVMGNNPSSFKGLTRPVETVSWFDAIAFCNALSELSGLEPAYELAGVQGQPGEEGYFARVRWKGLDCPGFRLPTEAEWERACRAGSTEPRWGELDDIAWFGANSGNETHPVAQKQANPWGFYDMLGLLWEWCWDPYASHGRERAEDPTGPPTGAMRTWKGGTWGSDPENLRPAARQGKPPSQRAFSVGIRCARTLIQG